MTIRQAVLKSASLLDRLKPGWWKPRRFSLRRLALTSCTDCILGQVFEREALRINKAEGHDCCTGFDFGLYRSEGPKLPSGTGEHGTFSNPDSEPEWRRLIERRRQRAKVA